MKGGADMGDRYRSALRRGGASAALVAVVALAPVVPASADSAGQPSLPERFASYSPLTASAWSSPPGRAIALYESGSSELFSTWQTLVVGADHDTYRTAELGDDVAPAVKLSPDGAHLLFHQDKVGTDEFTLLDLTTGQTRVLHSVTWSSNVGMGIDMLAWSPDGRYVAYAVPAPPPGNGRAESSLENGHPIADLAILDVVADTTTRLPGLRPVRDAAFAPDSRHLAVQIGDQVWITTLDGRRERQVTLPTGTHLVSDTAWSPDGALLAVSDDHVLSFVDATDQGRPTLGQVRSPRLLGWRGPTSVVTSGLGGAELALVEADLRTGQNRTLTRFGTAHVCEYGLRRCLPYRPQLATGLLSSATIRASDPDRGPTPFVLPFVLRIIVAGALVALGVFVYRRLRSRGRK